MKQQILKINVIKDGEVIASFENCSGSAIASAVELYHGICDKIELVFETIEVGSTESPAK